MAELVLGAQVNKHAPGRGCVGARPKLNVDVPINIVVLLVGSVSVVLFLVKLVSAGRDPSVRPQHPHARHYHALAEQPVKLGLSRCRAGKLERKRRRVQNSCSHDKAVQVHFLTVQVSFGVDASDVAAFWIFVARAFDVELDRRDARRAVFDQVKADRYARYTAFETLFGPVVSPNKRAVSEAGVLLKRVRSHDQQLQGAFRARLFHHGIEGRNERTRRARSKHGVD